MKSVVSLWVTCLREAGDQHHVRTLRDEAYALSRAEQEGLSFLTITLPAFEKDLLRAVSQGYVGSNHFAGFRRRGGLPTFLSGFLCQLFGLDGVLRPDANPGCLRAIRQILLIVSKIELPTTSQRKKAALDAYVETDGLLEDVPLSVLDAIAEASRRLLLPYLAEVEKDLWFGDFSPRHSSGALATRETYNARFSNVTWTERLQGVFPWWEDLAVSWREVYDLAETVSVLAREDEPPVKVALVPKTMKGPRIIAEEPVWIQFVQQGIFRKMTDVLQKDRHRNLADLFSWKDQEPNRVLAREGSLNGDFATLDLSEASDRVHLQLVEAVLRYTPFLRECVLAARSERAKLPDGRVISLRKFASMGSSLCFPMESLVFFALEAIAVGESMGMVPSDLRISTLKGRVRVYGDDLIVPTQAAQILIRWLEASGLKVNSNKSFTTGNFRESCGSDWFQGIDVSVFKLKHPFPDEERQPDLTKKAVSFHNHAYSAGWFDTAAVVERHLQSVFHYVPYCPVGYPVSALWSHEKDGAFRSDPGLHCTQVRTFVFRQVKPVDALDGYGAYKKCLQDKTDHAPYGVRSLKDKKHLVRDGRSRYAGVHIGWSMLPAKAASPGEL